MGIKKFFKAFKDAGRGFCDAVAKGKNLRVELVAAAWALLAVWTSGRGKQYYIAVLLTSAVVIGLECLNSALETLCDRVTRERDSEIRKVKDMAAGAVLAASVAALAVGLFLFLDLDLWRDVLASFLTGNAWAVIALALLPVAAAVMAFAPEKKESGRGSAEPEAAEREKESSPDGETSGEKEKSDGGEPSEEER